MKLFLEDKNIKMASFSPLVLCLNKPKAIGTCTLHSGSQGVGRAPAGECGVELQQVFDSI